MIKKLPYIFFFFVLFIFCREIFIKGYILGGFDFEVGFFYPWNNMEWATPELTNAALHYKNYLVSDSVGVILPVKLYAMRLIQEGIAPLWNPLILNGTSLIGNIQAAVMYPLNVMYFVMPAPAAYTLYVLAQLIFALIFMYVFLRKIGFRIIVSTAGAISFAFSAYIIVWLTLGTIGHAYVWIPMILWCFEQYRETGKPKYFIGIVAGLVFSLFAGHMQTSVFTFATYILWVLCSTQKKTLTKTIVTLALSLLLSAGIAAIAIIPAYETYTQSVRGGFVKEDFFAAETLNLSSYIQALAPDFFGHPVTRNWWGKINYAESAIYFGTIPFILFLYGLFSAQKKNRFYISSAIITATGIMLSTNNIFSYTLFSLNIPIVSSSTFARFSSMYIFGGVLLSTFGLTQLLADIKTQKAKRPYSLLVALIVLLLIYWSIILLKILPATYIEHITIITRNSIFSSVFIVALAVIVFSHKLVKKNVYIAIAILVLITAELLRFGNKYTPFSPAEFFYPNHPVISKLQELSGKDGSRYYDYLPINANVAYGVPGLGGSDPLYNQQLGELAIQSKELGAMPTDRGAMQFPDGPYKQRILDIFGVQYYPDYENNFRNSWVGKNGGKQELFDETFSLVWEENLYQIYQSKNAVPRAYVVYNSIHEDNKEKVFAQLTSAEFDPKKKAIVSFEDIEIKGEGTYSLTTKKITPHEIQYLVSSDTKGLFVLTDTYYPGWKAHINGKEAKILRTNWGFRSVTIEPGTSEIVFTYKKPRSIMLGASISAISLLILVMFVLIKSNLRSNTV